MGAAPAVTGVPEPPLLEREAHLGALLHHAQAAEQGSGRLVLVSGEAGVGKSTLVDRFRPSLSGADWLQGACDGLFTPRPLAPLLDMAEQLGAQLCERIRSSTARETLFPEVLGRIANPDGLTVVVVEDVHWADEATLDLLRYLGRRIRDAPTLVVVTYRDDALAVNEALQMTIGDLSRVGTSRRVELAPLSRDAVAELSRDTGRDAGELHRLTAGNPFFLSEVLRSDGDALPPSVRDAVLARVASLSKGARRTLESAALAGLRAEHHLLSALAEVTDLDELLAQGLLVTDGPAARFTHELARRAIEDSVPAHRRPRLHRQILDALLAAGCDDHARLAFHAEGCADGPAVVAHAGRAAGLALAMGSSREALAQCRQALEFAPDGDDATRAGLHDALADAHLLLDEPRPAAAARQRAIQLWTALGDVRRRADSLRRLSWAQTASDRPDAALANCRQAVDLLLPLGPGPELAWAHSTLSRHHMVAGEIPQALEESARAQTLAEELDLPDVLSDALNTEACSAVGAGRPWRDQITRALTIALSIPHAPLAARAYYNMHGILLDQLHFEESETHFDAAVAHADEHDLRSYARCLRRERGASLLARGLWDEALATGLDQMAEVGIPLVHGMRPRLVVGLVRARRGAGDVSQVLDEALALAEIAAEPQFLVPARVARAEAAWLAGDADAAEKQLILARDLAPEARNLVRDLELWSYRTGLTGSGEGHLEPVRLELAGQCAAAAKAWDELSCPYDAALALLGSEDETHLREAVVRLAALGAAVPADLARQRMRDRGYGPIPSVSRATTRAHPKGLTRREQEVLDLVAAGLRNRDIADRLFLSPKTVAVHVSSIMRKLDAASRTEAATWVHRTAQPSI